MICRAYPETKICFVCKKDKPISLFSKNKRKKDGLEYRCLECSRYANRISYKKNPKKVIERTTRNQKARSIEVNREYHRNYYLRHYETIALYRDNNRELLKNRAKNHYENNKFSYNAKEAKRRAVKLQRTPKWLTKEDHQKIKNIYENCPKGYHVDHIIPLQGKNISGLHVPSNLTYLPATDNRKKSNKFNCE